MVVLAQDPRTQQAQVSWIRSDGGAKSQTVVAVLGLLLWCVALFHAVCHGLDFLHNLGDVRFDPPPGTAASEAEEALVTHAPLKLRNAFPLSVAIHVQGRLGPTGRHSSVVTKEVAQFAQALATKISELSRNHGKHITTLEGYDIIPGSAETSVGRARNFYFTGDNSSTIFILHLPGPPVAPAYHLSNSLCANWTSAGGALEGYGCSVFGEYSLGAAAKEAAISAFEASDMIGLPFALAGLLFAIGPLALVILITLPVGILCGFDANLQLTLAFPHSFKVPSFAPAILVSFSVATSLDYALFLSSRYRAEMQSGQKSHLALKAALFTSGRTVLISGLIMIMSNLGAVLIPNLAVRSLCISIGVCCGVTTVLNLTLLPSLLFITGPLFMRTEKVVTRLCTQCCCRPKTQSLMSAEQINLQPIHTQCAFGHDGPEGVVESPQTFPEAEGVVGFPQTSRMILRRGLWWRIAKVIVLRPRTIMIMVLFLGLPVCLQTCHLKPSVSVTALVPVSSGAIHSMDSLGQNFPLGVCDVKRMIVLPQEHSNLQATRLPANDCVDDDPSVMKWAASLHLQNVTCVEATYMLGCNHNVATFLDKDGANQSVSIGDYCPRSCPNACTAASVLSRHFMNFVGNVSTAVIAATNAFVESRGIEAHQSFEIVESSAIFDGKYISFEQAEQYLASFTRCVVNNSFEDVSCDTAKRYAERLQALSNYNRRAALLNCLAPFSTFASVGFDWVSVIYQALEPNVATATAAGPIVINGPGHEYNVLFGDIMNDMQASIHDLLATSPVRLLIIVTSTVMLASLVAFRSVLIGPRLLLTVLFTLSFTMGLCVWIFQDIAGRAGIHWTVLLVSVPIMLGLTLDYDIFLLSKCYELRLSGNSTLSAVACALQDTGPIITTAGFLMILAFLSMCFTDIPVLYQTGAVLVTCCFVDTFVVRTLLVPSMMLILVDYNWWPGKVPPICSESEFL